MLAVFMVFMSGIAFWRCWTDWAARRRAAGLVGRPGRVRGRGSGSGPGLGGRRGIELRRMGDSQITLVEG